MTTTDDAFTGSPDQSERRRLIPTNTWHHGITKLISWDSVALLEESDGDTHTHTHCTCEQPNSHYELVPPTAATRLMLSYFPTICRFDCFGFYVTTRQTARRTNPVCAASKTLLRTQRSMNNMTRKTYQLKHFSFLSGWRWKHPKCYLKFKFPLMSLRVFTFWDPFFFLDSALL